MIVGSAGKHLSRQEEERGSMGSCEEKVGCEKSVDDIKNLQQPQNESKDEKPKNFSHDHDTESLGDREWRDDRKLDHPRSEHSTCATVQSNTSNRQFSCHDAVSLDMRSAPETNTRRALKPAMAM